MYKCFFFQRHRLFKPFLLFLFVPRLFEEKRGKIVFSIPSFHPSVRPSVPLQVVGILCMQLLLQFYANFYETLHDLGHGLIMCLMFFIAIACVDFNDLISGFCLFNLILYVPSTIFQLNRDGSSWVEPVLS